MSSATASTDLPQSPEPGNIGAHAATASFGFKHATVGQPARFWQAFHAARHDRKLRHREAAASLGLSEGEAIALHVGADDEHGGDLTAMRLVATEAPILIAALDQCGPLMALTRNEAAVHERTGVYENASENSHVGLVLGPDIDLRIFYKHWHEAFLVRERTREGDGRLSLQFFDRQGQAVHKIFERPRTDRAKLLELAGLHRSDDQEPHWLAADPGDGKSDQVADTEAETQPDDNTADLEEFLRAWSNMTDTHEFFGLLKRFGLPRTRAMAVARGQFTERVAPVAVRDFLASAAEQSLEIMVFVGNRGCIQIHTGAVKNVQVMGSWLNVLDPAFNLHLREDLIHEAWIVRKPTADGVVTSLEAFDERGETIALCFGKRKPGIPEHNAWRDLAAELEQRHRLEGIA